MVWGLDGSRPSTPILRVTQPQCIALGISHFSKTGVKQLWDVGGRGDRRKRIVVELMPSDRQRKASREGSTR